MIVLGVVAGFVPGVAGLVAGVAGGLCAWIAGLALWPALPSNQRRQCIAMIAAGALAFGFAIFAGGAPQFERIATENLGLLAMIAAVTFVRLVQDSAAAGAAPEPRGPRALAHSLLAVNVLGAAINITALVLATERIARAGTLHLLDAAWLSRAFTLAVLYSPFIGGMAFALARAPDADFAVVAGFGVALNLAGLVTLWLHARRFHSERVAEFEGYPLRPRLLVFPLGLAVVVLVAASVVDDVPVLTLIAAVSPIVVAATLLARRGAEHTALRLTQHVVDGLPRMTGELWLFLSAGVLAAGVASALAATELSLPISHVDGYVASVCLGIVLLVSALGLHPIIGLSALLPLLAPFDPDPELVVVLCVTCWSFGCAICPYAGTNVIVAGRFGLGLHALVRHAYSYAAWMWLLSSVALVALG